MTVEPFLKPAGLVRRIPLKAHELVAPITPQSDLFVLAHIGIPQVEKATWHLDVVGAVERPYRLTYDELQQLPKYNIESFHQCAGFPLRPDIPTRRIVNVVWSGASVRDVLAKATVKSAARFLWAYGLDHGDFEGKDEQYTKDLPLTRLQQDDWLLAYEINGEPLTPEHGFPVRLVAPGFYGTNCVKWLCRLELAEERCPGTFTRVLYNDPVRGKNEFRPVWEAGPESLIVAPADGSMVSKGRNEVWGWAWGCRPISRVDVSCDGGTVWSQATLEPRHQWSWQRFSLAWMADRPGPHTFIARASDVDSNTQPLREARNAVHSISVTVI